MKVDCHIHSSYSPDGFDPPRKIIEQAVSNGFSHICITDHTDLMYFKPECVGLVEISGYVNELLRLKDEFRNKIYVSAGIECGWTEQNENASAALLKNSGLEYVINSVHEVNGSDSYFAPHFEGRDKDDVYNEYFDACIKSLNAPYKYHAIGHISYVSRMAPYSNKRMRYADFPDKIDTLLKGLIGRGTIVELNTNGYGCGTDTLPDLDIIARFKELGGKHITFSSDAHRTARLGDNYEKVAEGVKNIGFKYWTVIENNEFKYLPI